MLADDRLAWSHVSERRPDSPNAPSTNDDLDKVAWALGRARLP
jgi:hypothetical protein